MILAEEFSEKLSISPPVYGLCGTGVVPDRPLPFRSNRLCAYVLVVLLSGE